MSAKQAIFYLKSNFKTLDKETIKKHVSKSNTKNKLLRLLSENKIILDADSEGFLIILTIIGS